MSNYRIQQSTSEDSNHKTKAGVIGMILLALLLLVPAIGIVAYLNSHGVVRENAPVARWPEDSSACRYSDRHAYVAFVMSDDPDSVANLEKLEKLANAIRIYGTIFLSKAGSDKNEEQANQALETAKRIPDSSLYLDDGSSEKARFGIYDPSSLILLVFDEQGTLITCGGIDDMDDLPGSLPPRSPISPLSAHSNPHSFNSMLVE